MLFAQDKLEMKEPQNLIEDVSNRFLEFFSKQFDTFYQNHRKNSFTGDDTKNYLRVSSLTGGCLRKEYYKHIKTTMKSQPFNVNNHLKMYLGECLHEMIQSILKKQLTQVEERFFNDEVKITGRIDGVLKSRLFEIKTCGQSMFTYVCFADKPKKAHEMQTQVYMNMTGLKHAYIVYVNRNIDLMFGTPDSWDWKSNFEYSDIWKENGYPDMFKVFDIEYSEEKFNETKLKAEDFWFRLENNKPPNKVPVIKGICNNCEYYHACRGEESKKKINKKEL